MDTRSRLLVLILASACGPEREPVDEEAYDLCEALYEQLAECGRIDEVTEEMSTECADKRKWIEPCRDLRREQFECYTALPCEELTDPVSNGYLVCEAALHEASHCYAEHSP